MGLDFDTLRKANIARLPQFKASTGAPAHTTKDGSDWSPAQWLQAVIGELGEFAEVRTQYERGLISADDYREQAGKELADIQIYLDILARRSFDKLTEFNSETPFPGQGSPLFDSPAQHLMHVIACLGSYANERKKLARGDYAGKEHEYREKASEHLRCAAWELGQLAKDHEVDLGASPGDAVAQPHHEGVDLGRATIDKFNQVSHRVGSTIYIELAYGRSQLHVEP